MSVSSLLNANGKIDASWIQGGNVSVASVQGLQGAVQIVDLSGNAYGVDTANNAIVIGGGGGGAGGVSSINGEGGPITLRGQGAVTVANAGGGIIDIFADISGGGGGLTTVVCASQLLDVSANQTNQTFQTFKLNIASLYDATQAGQELSAQNRCANRVIVPLVINGVQPGPSWKGVNLQLDFADPSGNSPFWKGLYDGSTFEFNDVNSIELLMPIYYDSGVGAQPNRIRFGMGVIRDVTSGGQWSVTGQSYTGFIRTAVIAPDPTTGWFPDDASALAQGWVWSPTIMSLELTASLLTYYVTGFPVSGYVVTRALQIAGEVGSNGSSGQAGQYNSFYSNYMTYPLLSGQPEPT